LGIGDSSLFRVSDFVTRVFLIQVFMSHAAGHPHHPRSPVNYFRLATWILGLILLLVVIFAVAGEFNQIDQRESPTVERLMSQWRSAGLGVGLILPTADPLGASVASEADVDGLPVIVYQFDPLDPKQLQTLEKIKAAGTVVYDGQKTPVLVNGPFVLAHFQDHPDKDVLVRTFQGFGTFEGIEAEQKLDMPPEKKP
jgi:hypothetical protein